MATVASDLSAAAGAILEDVRSLFAPIAPVLDKVGQDFTAARVLIKDTFEKVSVDVKSFSAYMQPATSALVSLGQGALDVGKTLTSIVLTPLQMLGRVAFDLTAGFAAVTGAASLFVSASNPGEMILFTRAIQDARASIGVFLEPLIQAGTVVLDSFNRMFTELQPVLVPVFAVLGEALKGIAEIAIELFRPVLEALAPAFETVLHAVMPLIDPLGALAAAVGDAVGVLVDLFAGALAAVLPTVVDLLRGLADVLTTTITTIQIVIERLRNWDITGAMNIGSAIEQARERMAEREEERLRRREQTGPGTVAARAAQFIGIEELGAQARLAAFGARSAETQREEQIRLLNRIAANTQRPAGGVAVGGGWDWVNAGQAAVNGVPAVVLPPNIPGVNFAGP